jgi:hypothetical protein
MYTCYYCDLQMAYLCHDFYENMSMCFSLGYSRNLFQYLKYIAFDGRLIDDDKLERTWNETIVI